MSSIPIILLGFIIITVKKPITPKTKESPEIVIMLIPNFIVQYQVVQYYNALLWLFHKPFDLEIN